MKAAKGTRTYWDIPGGRIDDTETIEQTLHRELSEELPDLKTYSIGNVLGVHRLERDLSDGNGLILVFYKVNAESFEVNLSDEHTEYIWVDQKNVSELLNPETPIEMGYCNAIVSALNE